MDVLTNQWTVACNYASQTNPAVAIGIGAVVATALVALSFTSGRQEPQVVVPTPQVATKLNLPQSEMIRLNTLLDAVRLQVDHSRSVLSGLKEQLNQLKGTVTVSDGFTNLLPSFLGNSIAKAVGAKPERAEQANRLESSCQAESGRLAQLETCVIDINRQIDLIKNVVALEGNIVDNRKTSENAQQILEKLTGDFDGQWTSLNKSERVVYYTPTTLLRSGLGCVLRVDSEKVYGCMTRKSTINAYQNIIQGCDQSAATMYRQVLKSLVDLTQLDQAQVNGRTHINHLMDTYKLAKQLKEAADSAWWAVEAYRWADSHATTVEREAEKDEKVSSWGARLDADWKRNYATSQISTVQQLSRELDSALKNVDVPRMNVKAIQNPLQGAAGSINNYDFWERMTNCHVHGFLHNLFEDLNNIKIENELAAIGKNAASIRENLINPLVDLLESERSVYLATDAGTLVDSKAFRQAASSYVRKLA